MLCLASCQEDSGQDRARIYMEKYRDSKKGSRSL